MATKTSSLGLLILTIVAVALCFFVSWSEGQNKTELFLFQSHTKDFWQVNADDAGTQAGEVGFIWREWDYYVQYHFVTMYQVVVNDSYNEYVPCEEGDTCANRYAQYPKHLGTSDMGFAAIPASSYSDYYNDLANLSPKKSSIAQKRRQKIRGVESESVQYFDFSWFSLPKGGICPSGEPLGTNNCGYYPVCAVKTVSRACLAQKPGWKESMNIDYYRLFAIMQTAFQETDPSVGGCPDMTFNNFTVCKNSRAILRNPESFGKIPDPRSPTITTKQKRSLPPKEEAIAADDSVTSAPTLSSPLIGIDVDNNSICQIMGNETDPTTLCKPLVYFDPPLNLYEPRVLMSASTSDGVVFIHLKTKLAAGCQPARILGYHYESNSIVYNFTVEYNLNWFDIDMNDGYLVGFVSSDVTVFRMQVVTISLNTLKSTIITPYAIFNSTNALASVITYDSINNIIYFFGIQGYLNYPVLVSYKIQSFTDSDSAATTSSGFNYAPRKLYSPFNSPTSAFPIILFNYTTVYSLSFAPNGNLYGIALPGLSTQIVAGVVDPATAILNSNTGIEETRVKMHFDQSTFDPISNELVFCIKDPNMIRQNALASYNVATHKWTVDRVVDYNCNLLPFRFVYGAGEILN